MSKLGITLIILLIGCMSIMSAQAAHNLGPPALQNDETAIMPALKGDEIGMVSMATDSLIVTATEIPVMVNVFANGYCGETAARAYSAGYMEVETVLLEFARSVEDINEEITGLYIVDTISASCPWAMDPKAAADSSLNRATQHAVATSIITGVTMNNIRLG